MKFNLGGVVKEKGGSLVRLYSGKSILFVSIDYSKKNIR